MEFEKLKKNYFPTDQPIPEKQGRVRGNKNIFKAGLTCCDACLRAGQSILGIILAMNSGL